MSSGSGYLEYSTGPSERPFLKAFLHARPSPASHPVSYCGLGSSDCFGSECSDCFGSECSDCFGSECSDCFGFDCCGCCFAFCFGSCFGFTGFGLFVFANPGCMVTSALSSSSSVSICGAAQSSISDPAPWMNEIWLDKASALFCGFWDRLQSNSRLTTVHVAEA